MAQVSKHVLKLGRLDGVSYEHAASNRFHSSAGTDVASVPSSADLSRAEWRQFPGVGSFIVANEIRIAVLRLAI